MPIALESNGSLWLFFVIAGAVGWGTSHLKTRLLKNIPPVSLALLDSGLTVLALLAYSLISDGWAQGVVAPLHALTRMRPRDLAYLACLALYGAGAGLIASKMLQTHGTVDFAMTGMLVSVAAAAAGVWWLAEDGITLKRGAGLLLLAAGGALAI